MTVCVDKVKGLLLMYHKVSLYVINFSFIFIDKLLNEISIF